LDSAKFRVRILAVEEAFRNDPVRSPALAGKSYPEEKEELRSLVKGFFDKAPDLDAQESGRVSGIIAPHIDFHRGSELFAMAYKALR